MSPDASNSGSDRNADLKLVDPVPDAESASPAPGNHSGSGSSRRRGVPIWLFVLGVIAFVLVTGWQAGVVKDLEADVSRLEGELTRSTALLEAHRSRLAEIRTGLHDVSDRLDGLRTLADADLGDSTEPVEPSEPGSLPPDEAGTGTPDPLD